jgi:hypothetical protein
VRASWVTGMAVILAATCGADQPCAPVECMRRVNLAVPVEKVFARRGDLPGVWHSQSSGMGGRKLYLFADGTYIYTEWEDTIPETIVDRGGWTFADALLRLRADPAVTWADAPDRLWLIDRRLLSIRPELQTEKWFLLGLDDTMGILDAAHITAGRLESWAFTRYRSWKAGEAPQAKAKLLKDAWRPESFRK